MNGTKPPYKVPSMREIEQIPWNGYNVVSTFSGGGVEVALVIEWQDITSFGQTSL